MVTYNDNVQIHQYWSRDLGYGNALYLCKDMYKDFIAAICNRNHHYVLTDWNFYIANAW